MVLVKETLMLQSYVYSKKVMIWKHHQVISIHLI